MSFNDNIHLDPSRVRTSGAGRKIVGAGGGSFLGILLILGFSYVTGIDLTSLISSSAPSSSSSSSSARSVPAVLTGGLAGCTAGGIAEKSRISLPACGAAGGEAIGDDTAADGAKL